MDIFATYATDEQLEVEGAWFDLSKTAKVRVARANNENYLATLRKKLNSNQHALDVGGKEADELAEGLIVEAMSETILLDWKGLQFKKKDVPYSKEMARTMLRIKDFRKRISGFADTFEAFKVKAEEEQGND